MNPYELADEFKNRNWDEVDCVLWCEKSANMLRQQANDLRFWKDQYSHVHSVCETYEKGYRQQADRIAELEKDLEGCEYFLNQHPIQDQNIYKTFGEWKLGQWLEDGEPRTKAYTDDELLLVEMGWNYGFDAGKTQTKPLSDEEIKQIWNDNLAIMGNDLQFARAIEAKVRGEK